MLGLRGGNRPSDYHGGMRRALENTLEQLPSEKQHPEIKLVKVP